VRSYCALFRDLSREREAESHFVAMRDGAMAASVAKTDFLAQISHEIRTPLSDQAEARARALRARNSAKPRMTPISPAASSAARR
jgi:hypothetical protein